MEYLNMLLSILLGIIPEAIFFAFFVIGAKRISKENYRLALIVAFIVVSIILAMFLSFNIWIYVAQTIVMYIILKFLYKNTEFIDMFLLTFPYIILAILGFACYGIEVLLSDGDTSTYIILAVNRILLIITMSALYPHLNKWYNSYRKAWNKFGSKKIKSITVRNISILVCNVVILAAYTMLTIVK